MGTLNVQVDSKGPVVGIPDSWYIWEPLAIQVEDTHHGIDRVSLTIDGGEYGYRSYNWAASQVPEGFIWDRHFDEVIAPIGDYPVAARAWDTLGNSATAHGEIVIPDPGSVPGVESAAPEALASSELADATSEDIQCLIDPYPLPSSGIGGPVAALDSIEGEGRGEQPPVSALASVQDAEAAGQPKAGASTEGGGNGLLWGAAALAAAASATAYGLSRRKARERWITQMRRRAAEMNSPEARQARLTAIWNAAQARVAPIRVAMAAAAVTARENAAAAAAAAAIAVAEVKQRIEEAGQRASIAQRQRHEQLRAEREQRLEQAELRIWPSQPTGQTTTRPATSATLHPTSGPSPVPTPRPTSRPTEDQSSPRAGGEFPPRGYADPGTAIPALSFGADAAYEIPRFQVGGLLTFGDVYTAGGELPSGSPVEGGGIIGASGGSSPRISQYLRFSLGPLDVAVQRTINFPEITVTWRSSPVVATNPDTGSSVSFTNSVSVRGAGRWFGRTTTVRQNYLEYQVAPGSDVGALPSEKATAGVFLRANNLAPVVALVAVEVIVGALILTGARC